jgi:hypothetical protein
MTQNKMTKSTDFSLTLFRMLQDLHREAVIAWDLTHGTAASGCPGD